MRQEFVERRFLGQPVRGLQYMLRRLALEYDFLPQLAADGVFGERTLEAVMLFQRELHPPVTGVVDRETWNAIQELWQQVEQRQGPVRPLRVFPANGFRVEPGAQWETLVLPQTMFQLLARQFNGVRSGEASGVHDSAFTANVRWLQRAGGLEETGVLDAQNWSLLSRLYEMFVVKERQEASDRFIGGWG